MKTASTSLKTKSKSVLYTSGMNRIAVGLLTLPFVVVLVMPLSASAVDCSGVPNTHPSVANEVAGVPAGTCVPDNQQNNGGLNGGCDENPYPALEQYRSGSNVQITPSGGSGAGTSDLRNGINPALACRLLKFFQYAQQTKGCQFKIVSAYRSAQLQQSICGGGGPNCAAPGRSCHQYGLAVDVSASPGQCMSWATSFLGTQNPNAAGAQQFKLHFPVSTDLVHIQCIENMQGGCSTNTKPCDGSVRINPDLNFTQTSNLPFDQQVRQSLGMQQQPPPPPAPPTQSTPVATPAATTPAQSNTSTQVAPSTDTLNTTPFPAGTCAPQTRCIQDDGNIYYRATTCVDQIYKKCPSGCTGLICNATSSTSNFTDSFFDDTDQSSSGSKATSTFDLIDFFANPPSLSSAIGTATPIDINQNIQDANNAEILGASPQDGDSNLGSGPSTGLSPGVTYQQTFTSGDLSNSPSSYTLGQSSTFQQTLAQMRAVLTTMLPYVTPFGGRVTLTQTYYAE